jgi:hypothetical protein
MKLSIEILGHEIIDLTHSKFFAGFLIFGVDLSNLFLIMKRRNDSYPPKLRIFSSKVA